MRSNEINFETCKIMVIGDVMLDKYMWGNVERISPEAPVPVFHIRKNSSVSGGAGNVLFNLVGLECNVSIIGLVGNDESGNELKRLFDHEIIEDLTISASNHTTITKTRIVSHGQQLMRIDDEEIEQLDHQTENRILELVQERIKDLDAIILSDYGKGMFRGADFAKKIISIAASSNIPVFIDPKGKDWERYQGATCITPNTKEFEVVYGSTIESDEELISAMHDVMTKYDLSYLLVTRGPKGMCLLSRKGDHIFIDSQALEVWDVSGAGDTVISTLAAGVASGMQFSNAARLANVAAEIVVSKLGTHPINITELKQTLRLGNGYENGFYTRKLMTKESAKIQIDAWKAAGEKIVFTNGCFDLLHPGHIYLLNKAKELGQHLVVGLNADESVKRLKGPERPVLNEQDRASILGALHSVDLVVIFSEDTPENLIGHIKPDILVKGEDYKIDEVVGKDIVESYGGEVRLVSILTGYSTTNIAEKIKSDRH